MDPGLRRLSLRRRGAGGGGASLSGLGSNQVVVASSATTVTSFSSFTYVDTTAVLDVAKSLSGSTAAIQVRNASNTASSGARVLAEVAGASGGNPSLRLARAGGPTWDARANNGTGFQFELIHSGSANPYFVVSTAGEFVSLAPTGSTSRIHRFSSTAASGGLDAGTWYYAVLGASEMLQITPDQSGTAGAGVAVQVRDTTAGAWKEVIRAVNRTGPPELVMVADGGTVGVGGTPTHLLDALSSSSGATITSAIRNTSNTASSGVRVLAEVAGASAGDPMLDLAIIGGSSWQVYVANASNDEFRIKQGSFQYVSINPATGACIISPTGDATNHAHRFDNPTATSGALVAGSPRYAANSMSSGAFLQIAPDVAGADNRGVKLIAFDTSAVTWKRAIHFANRAGPPDINLCADGGTVTVGDAVNFVFNTGTGTKLGSAATQKLALWNATPIVQPSSTGETTGFTAGAGAALLVDSTFTGNVGTKAYTVGDIVKHLKNLGAMAAS